MFRDGEHVNITEPYSVWPNLTLKFYYLHRTPQGIQQIAGSRIFLSERELEELCTACGLVDFKCLRNRQFVMLSATKRS